MLIALGLIGFFSFFFFTERRDEFDAKSNGNGDIGKRKRETGHSQRQYLKHEMLLLCDSDPLTMD